MFCRWISKILLIILLAGGGVSAQEVTPEVQPTATLGGAALRFVTGRAAYQNRLPDQSGIHVQVLDAALNLIGTATTDAQGVFAVAAPSADFYWLVVTAPLHRSVTLPMYPGDALPDMILAGGDFNQDGCVGPSDLAVLVGALDVAGSPATDITGDGLTDVSDLAIVTGNYQPDCEPVVTETPEAAIEFTPEVEATDEVTPESTAEATAELTPETTVEATPESTVEVTPEVEVTVEPTQEMTPELTAEVTEAIIPEVTEELTPEVTVEPTSELPTATLVPTPTPEPTLLLSLTPEPTVTETPAPTELMPERTEESTT